jgi:prolyl-tRNA synthetase
LGAIEGLRAVLAEKRAELKVAKVDRENLNETAAQARETAAAVARAEAELVRERERVEQFAAELAQARQRRGLFRRRG